MEELYYNRSKRDVRGDLNATSEVAAILPTLVLQCTQGWAPKHLVELWHVPFENLVFGPLHALHSVFGPGCKAFEALSAYISALERPIVEYQELLYDAPETAQRFLKVELATGRA